VFKLCINGEKMVVGRYPDFETPTSFTIEIKGQTQFKLFEIVGVDLGD